MQESRPQLPKGIDTTPWNNIFSSDKPMLGPSSRRPMKNVSYLQFDYDLERPYRHFPTTHKAACRIIITFRKAVQGLYDELTKHCNSFFFFPFFVFLWPHPFQIWRFPGYGSNRNCSRRLMPQWQQCWIWATSATYTTAHGNAGSSIHWEGQGSNPHPYGCEAGSLTDGPQW